MLIDSYLIASDGDKLATFCAAYKNVLGPATGRDALPESTCEGVTMPAQAAVGDPANFYACVRSQSELSLPAGVSVCDAATGRAVCGVWA